ncbi:helicase-exonuclease AddAB subunit AddA [Paenibacillus psychroresistens]|uniref:ATP-dependent helicase/nuclease subunit A n=2 Tax=Paenibacillus psychroresistens TaxID=1778678 RepID=A0A6B8RVX0_9BACL|nr:helicase-exonuclease AddAB subunit AddA [Paenibacillus psychroresistens]
MDQASKPIDSTWTDDQWEAISLRGSNILVAAAAGSGKTAVLVERIIRQISDVHNPLDVDRLLVATFTKAAAAEMRHRIGEALEKALFAQPESQHLRRQLALIHRASITTLHSFCMEVIQRYFQMVQLDPGFRIANETEAALLRHDQLQDLLEECYGENLDEQVNGFWLLVEWFSGERNDDALMALIEQLYDSSRSHPDPAKWLLEKAARFNSGANGSSEDEEPWLRSLTHDVHLELNGVEGLLLEAIRIVEQPGGPLPYMDNLEGELSLIRYLQELSAETNQKTWHQIWGDLYEAFQTTGFGRLNPCKGDTYDKGLQENVKQLRDRAKDQFSKLKVELFGRSLEQFSAELTEMAPLMQVLVDLVLRFGERYMQAKIAKGLLDFADLEHYCLQILRDPASTGDELLPSRAALDYQEQFVEVLLDEYQDTNRVQEAIIDLISRKNPGNRFIVGDVKQSIYRFRLAEPGLFLEKYKSYQKTLGGAGRRIDLAANFRSRREVVDGVNYIFKQVMNESVGEVAYDRSAELVYGAGYPESEAGIKELSAEEKFAIELLLIDRSGESSESSEDDAESQEGGKSSDAEEDEGPTAGGTVRDDTQELKTAEMEARLIALHIRRLMGMDGQPAFQVWDKKAGGMRPIAYRDIVILLRATRNWAPTLMEELRLQTIPAYADLNTGYFTAMEIEVVISLLQIIDNPMQDIPLAAVLRSPIVGLTADELATIRLAQKQGSFYLALLQYVEQIGTSETAEQTLSEKLISFIATLEVWREDAKQGALADLIWGIYRTTGFYDFVGGMPGGVQRQANLRALYDRARQYEATSFRGLFRFLRFIERMQDSGGDLGTARALGEQEDVVRIISIHKSKGLEFPVVFVAGLAKMFNQQDLNSTFLLHKELGFGPKYVDTKLRVSYPSLPYLAIRRRMRLEMLAEEMRVLYVAMTRAREKLYLVGTVRNLDKQLLQWGRQLPHKAIELPDYELAKARCYLDWIGPSLIRHPHAESLRVRGGFEKQSSNGTLLNEMPSHWKVVLAQPELFVAQAAAASEAVVEQQQHKEALLNLTPIPLVADELSSEIEERLSWKYSYEMASQLLSKTSVTELKRLGDSQGSAEFSEETRSADRRLSFRRPRFIEQQQLNAAERGTVYHAVMQQLPINAGLTLADIQGTLDRMLGLQMITSMQYNSVDVKVIHGFFGTDLGHRLLNAKQVLRETPFSYGLQASEIYPFAPEAIQDEMVLIQGVIDCLFEDEQGLILLDYKTDAVRTPDIPLLAEKYRVQLELYAKAVEQIWKKPVTQTYLFYFDGAHLIELTAKR